MRATTTATHAGLFLGVAVRPCAGPMVLRVTRRGRSSECAIETVNQASAWWCRYRDARGLGSSTMPRVEIVVGGEVRAHVSYNGKVWEGATWKSGAVPVFDPFAEAAEVQA